MKMKNVIKKIAAISMAFSLLCAGSINTFSAFAGTPPQNCSHSSTYPRSGNVYCEACGTKLGSATKLSSASIHGYLDGYIFSKAYQLGDQISKNIKKML